MSLDFVEEYIERHSKSSLSESEQMDKVLDKYKDTVSINDLKQDLLRSVSQRIEKRALSEAEREYDNLKTGKGKRFVIDSKTGEGQTFHLNVGFWEDTMRVTVGDPNQNKALYQEEIRFSEGDSIKSLASKSLSVLDKFLSQ